MDEIKRYLPENFYINLPKKALNRALMSAINDLASYYAAMIEDAIDQQFVSSASGKYLLYLGEQYGFSLPPKSGLDIAALKILIPTVVSSPKQITSSLQKLVAAFYSELKTKPNLVAAVAGPYSLVDGDSLIVEAETGRYEITVLASAVADIANVDSSELASIINTSQSAIKADTFVDVNTGARYLRLASASFGIGAFLRVVGGAIQNSLSFPDLRGASFASGTKFLAAKDAAYSDMVRLTWDGAGASPSLFKVEVGDFVTIKGLTDTQPSPNSLLNGTYEVLSSGYDSISFKENRDAIYNPAEIIAYSQSASNIIQVSYQSHGFTTGMRVNVSSSSSLGNIGYGEVSAIEAVITVTSPDGFRYTVSTYASSSETAILNSVVPSAYYYAKSSAQFSCASAAITVLWGSHGLIDGDPIVGVCHDDPAYSFDLTDSVTVSSHTVDSITFTLSGAPDGTGEFFAIGRVISVPSDISIVVTSQKKMRIYDKSEYAYVSEAIAGEAKVLVPAVPPISRRFLKGSGHLHGQKFPVLDFDRSSITLDISSEDGTVSVPNAFVISNNRIRPDFSLDRQYDSTSANFVSDTIKTFFVTGSDGYATLPYTALTSIGSNPIYAVPGSDELVLTFPFKHGLRKNWQFTLSAGSGSGSISAGQLDGDHVVWSEKGSSALKIKALDSNGNPIVYSGEPISGFDVYQAPSARVDGADFYLQFPNPTALTSSGLVQGSIFGLNKTTGVDVFSMYAKMVRQCNYSVVAIESDKAYFHVGVGAGVVGLVLSGGAGGRSSNIGGACLYFFDKTSAYNIDYVLDSLFAMPTAAQISNNTGYIGSFLYDPEGKVFPYAVSDVNTSLSAVILRGSSPSSIFVPSVDGWANSGYLYFAYGSSNQEGPVPYRAVISVPGNSQIFIDPSYVFNFTHNVGDLVTRLSSLSPLAPGLDQTELPVYLTGTAAARETLKSLLQATSAYGIVLDWNVLLPSLRYDDVSIQPYADSIYPSRAGAELGLLPVWPS